ncbi:hypothetical protein OHA72_47955 [Dactylosporangium sp. NBC_01737]|uniref:hypothetical protein n=1 Tax=Dactylosporangium sp. NBC_01737 TaxID=2975959 RepID=UPI002E11A056|nr:hypothetical protein OHA72_47955 [Dactylosporangium sp. NBC_01737]
MRRLPLPQLVASLLVAALCGVALLQAIRPAVHSGRMGVKTVRTAHLQHPTRQFRELIEYLSNEMRRQVPAGTRVLIVEDVQDLQLRMIEFAVLHGLVVVAGDAQVKVYLQKDPAAPYGMWLRTQELADA